MLFFIFQKVFKSDLGKILCHAIGKYPDIQYYLIFVKFYFE